MVFALVFLLSACAPTPLEISSEVSTPTATGEPTGMPLPSPSATPSPTATSTPVPKFSFVVTSDMSYTGAPEYIDYPHFFAALLGYVKIFGPGEFMVSTGDVLPAADTRWSIDQVLGEDYVWFPLPGNHDFGAADFDFLQNYSYDPNGADEPNVVRWGPEPCPRTTYSFDYQNTHFVMLNVYCNEEAPWGIDGSISDTIYDWLSADLAGTKKENIFVFGHEPAFPQPDDQTGIMNHLHESLDQYPEARDRFWALLADHNVVAYIHGHTHNYSAVKINGVWEIDAGHAAGTRYLPSPGTFLIITVEGENIFMKTYRGEEAPGYGYLLREDLTLSP